MVIRSVQLVKPAGWSLAYLGVIVIVNLSGVAKGRDGAVMRDFKK